MIIRPAHPFIAKTKAILLSRPFFVVLILLTVLSFANLARDVQGEGDSTGKAGNKPQQSQARQELTAQVDTPKGEPQTGRDPAAQPQNGLSAAASRPSGFGQRTETPATGVTGTQRQTKPSDVYKDPTQTGIGSNGCYVDYGVQGQQCLPAHAAGDDKTLTCSEVRAVKGFENGIKVTGTDRFHLDADGNGTACTPGEESAHHAH
jgi:hypothetical protein